MEHGIFEVLQGNARPDGIMINSMGPPCVPEQIWNACEPAMTIIPSFLVTGILAIILGLIGIAWSLFFIERRRGGLVLALLSFAMLLFGGGIFPPLIGIIGGVVGTRINTPLSWWRKHLTGAPFVLTDLVVILIMSLICLVPFALFVRGVGKAWVGARCDDPGPVWWQDGQTLVGGNRWGETWGAAAIERQAGEIERRGERFDSSR